MGAVVKPMRTYACLVLAMCCATAWGQLVDPPAGNSSASDSTAQPKLEYEPKEFSFGEVWEGQKAEQEFTVRNAGNAPLELNVKATCGCTALSKPDSPLAPGASTKFTVKYDTKRLGQAHKRVLLKTNDPMNAQATIMIEGNVKGLFDMQPRSVVMHGLQLDSRESRTVTMVNQYDKPVELKLRKDQDFGVFDVDFREVERGYRYELKVSTKPPLRTGFNRTNVKIETGLDIVPELDVRVVANAQPRVVVFPFKIAVPAARSEAYPLTISVQYREHTPIKVLDVRADYEGFEFERLPSRAPAKGRQVGAHQFRVMVPPYDSIPDDGYAITILTDDAAPEFKKLEIPIERGRAVPKRDASATPRRMPIPKPDRRAPDNADNADNADGRSDNRQ